MQDFSENDLYLLDTPILAGLKQIVGEQNQPKKRSGRKPKKPAKGVSLTSAGYREQSVVVPSAVVNRVWYVREFSFLL